MDVLHLLEFNTHCVAEIIQSWFFIHYLAVWNNDYSRCWGRIEEKYLTCWLIINKPQPKLHSGDTYLGPEGVPSIKVPLHMLTCNWLYAKGNGRMQNTANLKFCYANVNVKSMPRHANLAIGYSRPLQRHNDVKFRHWANHIMPRCWIW